MAASTTSLGTLRGRCVVGTTGTQYRSNFYRKTVDMIRSSNITPAALFDGSTGKETIANLNRYGKLTSVQVMGLTPGKVGDTSGFIKRIKDGGRELLITQEGAEPLDISTTQFRAKIAERILNGDFPTEHMFGGLGERLLGQESAIKVMGKFSLVPRQLSEAYGLKFPKESFRQSTDVLGKYVKPYSLGVRHMLAYTYAIAKLADEYGMDRDTALKNQTVFIITNPEIDGDIREEFERWNYFGLDKDKVFFMASEAYPAIVLGTNGDLQVDATVMATHNHGTARLQTSMDNIWSPVHTPGRMVATPTIRSIYEKAANLQSLNIEDVSYLSNALDLYAMMIASGMVADEYKDFGMIMDVVGQNPLKAQKGGILALDPTFDNNGDRLTMIEAFTAYPEYYHWDDKVAEQLGLYKKFEWLNLNNNNYPNPVKMFDHLRTYGIPAYPEVKETGQGVKYIRNECPQGELAHFLPTVFVARMEQYTGRRQPEPVEILSVKVSEHIPLGLSAFLRQDDMQGFLAFAKEFEPK